MASIRSLPSGAPERYAPRAIKVVERWRRWRNGARSARVAALGFAYLDYSGSQVAGIVEVSVDRATAGRSRCIISGVPSTAASAVQPDNVIAQTESSIVYGLGVALTERITIKDGAVEQ